MSLAISVMEVIGALIRSLYSGKRAKTRRRRGMSYRLRRLRLIASRLRAERDREAVPAVDPDDREREVDKRLLVEMTPDSGVKLIRHVVRGDLRDRLGPDECGPLTVRVAGRLPPCRQQVQPLLGFASGARFLGVHVEAMCAAVDLRDTRLHEFQQRVLQPRASHVGFDAQHCLVCLGRYLFVIDALRHCHSPWKKDGSRRTHQPLLSHRVICSSVVLPSASRYLRSVASVYPTRSSGVPP